MTFEGPAGRPGRLGVGVVGAGRVGAVIGSALRAAGHPVVAVSAVSEESRARAETMLPGVPILEITEVVRRSELVLLAVPDDALASLVQGLARVGAWQAGQIVVHTSGRHGVRVLDPARPAGVIPLALHPAMTFTGTSLDLSRLVGCPFAVTGPGPVLPIGQALVVEIGEPVGKRVDIALDIVQPRDLAREPALRHMAVALAQMAEQPADEPAVLFGAGLAEIGEAASGPQPPDHRPGCAPDNR